MSRFGLILSFPLLALVWWLTTPAAAANPRLTADTLGSLLDQALAAFGQADFEQAATLFGRIETEFAREPELQDPQFLRRMLPLKGQAELGAGRSAQAARTLQQFVERFPDDAQHAAALYGLAVALRRQNDLGESLRRFEEFGTRYPHRPEAALAVLQRGEILAQTHRTVDAIALLEQFSEGASPTLFRHQARVRALRLATAEDAIETSTRLLLGFSWAWEEMADLPEFSFAAMTAGDRLLEAGRAEDALTAYRLVPTRAMLLRRQEDKVRTLEHQVERAGSASSFWRDYLRALLAKTRHDLESLRAADDHTLPLHLRRGQAFLLADRPREAWLIFEYIALDEQAPDSLRVDAHYRWIVAASALARWEEALTIARNFVARYPESELAPHALHLIAQAHQEQRRYGEANEILYDLLNRFPSHPLAPRWTFTRGFNRVLLEDFTQAREDFHRVQTGFADASQRPNAELWHALTFFFERDYSQALRELENLLLDSPRHPLAGEIRYRIAATLYAMRELEKAEDAASEFVRTFPHHPRHPEALVLLGDVRMGLGLLDQARQTFADLPIEEERLFLYGLFQRGKILRAQNDLDGMIVLLTGYVSASSSSEKPRMSEALYWIAWAKAQLGREAEAIPLLIDTINAHGNEPRAVEILSLLQLLDQLDGRTPLIESQPSWIESRRQEALEAGELTLFSRLSLHLAAHLRGTGRPASADAILFEIADLVPASDLGSDALGQVGHLLTRKDLSAGEDFLIRLLKDYPHAPERALAFHGLGARHFAQGRYAEALAQFRRFLHETPTHPLQGETMLLAARCLAALGRDAEAIAQLEEILRLRSLRGRSHAEALETLARIMVTRGEIGPAIAYYQRIYTVHRAHPDLVGLAYLESGRLFASTGDYEAARRTFEEMLRLPELADSALRGEAQTLLSSLPGPATAAVTP